MGAQHDEAFTVGEVLTIGNGELELGVIPRQGGSWTSLRVRRGYCWADILRPAAAPALRAADRLGFANWPLCRSR